MPIACITAVMVPVTDVQAALAWYRRAFPQAALCCADEAAFEYLSLGGISLEFVPSDDKVSSGPCGSVVYWRVRDCDAMLQHLQSLGGRLYRGPMPIEGALTMCQVQDPWGNCIGIRGPSRHAQTSQ